MRASLAALTLAIVSIGSAHAMEVTPLRGYTIDKTEVKDRAIEVFYIRCITNAKFCGGVAPGKSGDLKLEGKSKHYKIKLSEDSSRVDASLIIREYELLAKRAGGLQVDEGSRVGPNVFRIPKPNQQGADWLILDQNYGGHYELILVEEQALEPTATLTASQMNQSLEASGSVALYIEFDTAKATIKPEGAATVKEIAALLKSQPALRLSVEGHTDNVGQAADNKRLSQARAESVMKAVVAQGIDAKRLKAVGHGREYPIADNRTEEGRGKNRRVELVKTK